MAGEEFLTYEQMAGGPAEQDTLSYEQAVGGAKQPGMLSRAPDEGYLSGLGKGAATATVRGLASIPGMFGNIRELGRTLSGSVLEAAGVPREAIQRGREMFRGPADILPTGPEIAAPILERTGAYEPESYMGKLGMTGLETGLSMIGPGAGAVRVAEKVAERALPAAARTAPSLGFETLKETAKMAPAGFAPGIAGEVTYDVTESPWAALGASLLAGGAQPALARAARTAARPVLEDLPVVGRRFAGERERMAAEQIQKLSSDPQAMMETLFPERGPAQQELVKGSRPTLGQLTGDIGVLEAERALRTRETEPFNILEAEQNAARIRALSSIPADTADSMKLTELVSRQASALEQSLEQAETQLQLDAVTKAEGLGPKKAPEQLGETLRKSIEDVQSKVKQKVSDLYEAVDPDGQISLVTTSLRDGVRSIAEGIDPYGVPMNKNEARIYGMISEMPDVLPFKSLVEMDKSITQAMKEAGLAGETVPRGRLIQAKSAVQEAINNAIENQQAYEEAAVRRGQMAPDQTTEARVREWVEGFYRDKEGVTPAGAPKPLEPSFDPEAAERLKSAKEAHKLYATTYRAEPVQGAIKTTGFDGQYKIPAGAVPGRAVVAGPKGFESARQFIIASNASPDALFAIKETLLNDLRGRVKNDVLGAKEINAWKSKYDGALRAVERYSPGFTASFDDAAKAADKLAEFGAQRKATEEAFQKSAAARFLGATDALEVENRVARVLRNKTSGVAEMRDLVAKVKGDPAALEGLRKATADWIVRNMSTAAEAATTGKKLMSGAAFQNLIRDASPILSQLMTEKQMNTLRAVAKDMERADRINQATRVKASPGTAKDFLKQIPAEIGNSSLMLGMFLGLQQAFETGGIKGLALLGAPLAAQQGFKHWRGSGMQQVQNLVRDALLDPTIARQLLVNVPAKQLSARREIVGKALQRSLYQPSEVREGERERYAKGGKVYPAKRMSNMEKAAAKAFSDIANETRPLMDVPDEHIAHALGMAAV